MPEHDKKATDCRLNTRSVSAAVAQGLNNDPQLHRPQQKVSILDDLVGEEASMSVTRRRPLATRDKARIGPDVSFRVSLDSPCLSNYSLS